MLGNFTCSQAKEKDFTFGIIVPQLMTMPNSEKRGTPHVVILLVKSMEPEFLG